MERVKRRILSIIFRFIGIFVVQKFFFAFLGMSFLTPEMNIQNIFINFGVAVVMEFIFPAYDKKSL